MWKLVIQACILLAVTTHAASQYADFFSGLNALLQPYTTTTRRHDVTKRPEIKHKPTNKHKNDDIIHYQADDQVKTLEPHSSKKKSSHTTLRTTTKHLNSNKISNNRNGEIILSISNSREPYNDVNYNRETTDRGNNWNYQLNRETTDRGNNYESSSNYGTSNSNRQNNEHNREISDRGNNWNYQSNRETTNRGDWNYQSNRATTDRGNNYGTTSNPLLNRPGVKPAAVDENKPPITNKPVTVRPIYDMPFDTGTYRPANTRPPYENDRQNYRPANTRPPFEEERPVRPGTTVRPGTERPGTILRPGTTSRPSTNEPDIELGPDEDDMSETERRRYYEICEQKCTEYKSASTRKVVALPLAGDQRAEFNVSSCTRAKVPLIIGGQVVDINQFPHMALVGWRKIQGSGYSWKCGGSLISERYVLTAGHSTYYDKDDQTVSGAPHAVQLGSSHLDGRDATVVSVSSIIRHPKYKFRRSYHDVAVIKLVATVRFSERISPACLGEPPPVGDPIIATGWGKTEFGGDNSLELRSVSLPIWDMESCKSVWGTSRKLPQGPDQASQICAGERGGGKDTCQGDSGGPAQIQDGCAWRVVAITSVGRSCGAPDTPALYARIPRAFVASLAFGNVKTNGGNGGSGNNNRGTGSNVWGSVNNGGNVNNNRGTESNVWGSINSGGNVNNNRGTDSNVWGSVSNDRGNGNNNGGSSNSNTGSQNHNRGTDSNVWGIVNDDRESGNNNGGIQNNNRGTESNIWGNANDNRGSASNVWGSVHNDRGSGNNRGTGNSNTEVENAWGVTANNKNENRGSEINNNGGSNNFGVANVRPDLNVQNNQKTTTIGYQNYNFDNKRTTEKPYPAQNYYNNNQNVYNTFPGVPWWNK